MVRKRIIITSNKEIYTKLNMLSFSNDVVLSNVSNYQINKIIDNINKYQEILSMEQLGDYLLLRKKAPLNFSVYFREK